MSRQHEKEEETGSKASWQWRACLRRHEAGGMPCLLTATLIHCQGWRKKGPCPTFHHTIFTSIVREEASLHAWIFQVCPPSFRLHNR